ncbi:MAG: dephospho-CoA kinase [Flavobacteriales bacterium]|nr:dephospho-CoA kinase [Flavobacteriales bacterium]
MKKIGLTGGIGVGKTFVSNVFSKLGIPVFLADIQAKKCMSESDDLKKAIAINFGNNIYKEGILQKDILANIVFNDAEKLTQLNKLVHPIVQNKFEIWQKEQTAPFVLKEAAILFESNAHIGLDGVICVTAPLETRIKRVIQRDNCTKESVLKRIENQMPQFEKEQLSDFVIVNDEDKKLLPQILAICKKINAL